MLIHFQTIGKNDEYWNNVVEIVEFAITETVRAHGEKIKKKSLFIDLKGKK